MTSLDRSIRSCAHQVIPSGLAVLATSFVTVVIVNAFQNTPLARNTAVGFVATLGALIGLFCIGRVYIYYKGPPEPFPDEERPASRESQMHPTMRPVNSTEEPHGSEYPLEPHQAVDEESRDSGTSPDHPPSDDARPLPLNIPRRPQANGEYHHHPEPSGAQNLDFSPASASYSSPGPGCPPSLRPGPTCYRPPHVSSEDEADTYQHAGDVNGSPPPEGSAMRGPCFAGTGPGHLPPSAPGLHNGPLRVVNLATLPARRDFLRFCMKHELLLDHLGIPELVGNKLHGGRLPLRPYHRRVKTHRVRVRSPVSVSPSACVSIDDSIGSDHSASSAADAERSPSSSPPSSIDTAFSIGITKE